MAKQFLSDKWFINVEIKGMVPHIMSFCIRMMKIVETKKTFLCNNVTNLHHYHVKWKL